jgi:hypothetical protein
MVAVVLIFRCDLHRLVLVVLVLFACAALAACGSTCGSNCPITAVDIVATSGENLNIATAAWMGSACPTDMQPRCRGDSTGANTCVRFTIIGSQPGTCELDLTFTDGRVPFSALATFDAETHQGCCHGFPVLGDKVVTVPPLHPVVLPDAGADVSDALPDSAGDSAVDQSDSPG